MVWNSLKFRSVGELARLGVRPYSTENLLDLLRSTASKSHNPDIHSVLKKAQDAKLRPVRLATQQNLAPRTGVLVGRSVVVRHQSQLPMAVAQLNTLNKINRMPRVVRLQRFAERPGKARLRIKVERKKRDFNAGIRRLFDLVREAQRKGY